MIRIPNRHAYNFLAWIRDWCIRLHYRSEWIADDAKTIDERRKNTRRNRDANRER